MNTYDNYLLLKTKKELTRLAKLHRMSGYSSLNKEALAEKLLEYIYRPSVMHDFLVYLGDDEIQLFSSPSRSSLNRLIRYIQDVLLCTAGCWKADTAIRTLTESISFLPDFGNFLLPEHSEKNSSAKVSFWTV